MARVYHRSSDKVLEEQDSKAADLPPNFHPAATGARLVFTPIGAG